MASRLPWQAEAAKIKFCELLRLVGFWNQTATTTNRKRCGGANYKSAGL